MDKLRYTLIIAGLLIIGLGSASSSLAHCYGCANDTAGVVTGSDNNKWGTYDGYWNNQPPCSVCHTTPSPRLPAQRSQPFNKKLFWQQHDRIEHRVDNRSIYKNLRPRQQIDHRFRAYLDR